MVTVTQIIKYNLEGSADADRPAFVYEYPTPIYVVLE
jgi:hypothetical protein